MKKTFITLGIFVSFGALAQNNVGIGTLSPNPQAILDISSSDKGVLISRLTTVARNTLGTALTSGEDGMLVYDKDLKVFYYWDGSALAWVQVGSGTGDNWGTQTVQTSGANISGDGTSANPLTVTDGDSDPTNEIELPTTATNGQVLTWDGTNWVAQNAPSGADNWGTQVVQTSGTNISGDGTSANPLIITDGDSDPTNEIELPTGGVNGQVLSTDGNGTYTWVNDNSGTDDQNIANLAFDNTTNILTVGIENGTSQTIDLSALINDADSDPNNEIQDLTLNGNILTITNNGSPTSIDLSSYLDNTDAQTLSLSGSSLSISNGNSITLTDNVNDADSDPTNEMQNLSVGGGNSNTSIINISGGTGVTIQVAGDLTITETGNVITIGGGTPPGAIMAFNLATCPTGWAPADGTGGMPDLRGEFVRGLDNGRGIDAGRTLASAQTGSIQSHNHSVNPPATNTTTAGNHNHSIDPPTTNTNTTGNHRHSVDPPNTGTTTNGNHDHTFTNQSGTNQQQFIAFARNDINPGTPADGTGYAGGNSGPGSNDRIWNLNPAGNHSHTVNIAPFNSAYAGNHNHSVNIAPFNSNTTGNHNHSVDIAPFNSASAGGSETRPRNVAFLYCIKQ